MFGFLFKRSKNSEKDANKGRRLSKDLVESPSLPPVHANFIPPNNSPTTHHPPLKVSTTLTPTDPLSPGKIGSSECNNIPLLQPPTNFSKDADAPTVASLGNGVIRRYSVVKESETELESIGFIDENRSEDVAVTGGCIGTSATIPTTISSCTSSSGDEERKRQLNDAERKAMVQVESIRSKLISKETELTLLQADINMLAVDRDNKAVQVQSMSSQLNLLQAENELAFKRIHDFEVQLEGLRAKNSLLSEQLEKKSDQLSRCLREERLSKPHEREELNRKIRDLEDKVRELEIAKREVLKTQTLMEKEKDAQIKVLQEALEDALEAKIKLQDKYDKDLRELQLSSSTLVDDFEWKLHQVESACRKKLQEKDKQIEEQINQAKLCSTVNFEEERLKLEEEKKDVHQQLRQVQHLKSYEAEVIQLRGVTIEQLKSLRAAARQLEQLKYNERYMQNEIAALLKSVAEEKNHCQIITNSTQRRLDAQELSVKDKLEKQKNELNSKWEAKWKEESARLRYELNTLHAEDKHLTVESMKLKKEEDISLARETWENARQELLKEISQLREELQAKEQIYQKEISKANATIDRDNWELRRKLDKITDAHTEEVEALKTTHAEEIVDLRQRYDNSLLQIKSLRKKIDEYEKNSRSTGSVEKDSGIAVDGSSISLLGHSTNDDSECSSESEEEEEEGEEGSEDEEEDEEESEEEKNARVEDNSKSKHTIKELREEVATLQDSIETLTLSLVNNETKEDAAIVIKENEGTDSTASEADASSFNTGNESSPMSDTDQESEYRKRKK